MKWLLATSGIDQARQELNFRTIQENSQFLQMVVLTFVDATNGAVSKFLPNGSTSDKVYSFVKTDASANAVTIYPFAGQFVNGGASTVLAAQGDKVTLIFDPASQSWWNV